MRHVLFGLAVALALQGSAASAAPSVKLVRAVVRINDNEVWGKWGNALACNLAPKTLRWEAGDSELKTDRMAAVFDEELVASGLLQKAAENLFEEGPSQGLQAGVIVTKLDAQICSLANDDGSNRVFRGKVTMSADWQIYDPVQHAVIARVSTIATGEEKKLSADGVSRILMAGFRANARELAATPEFKGSLTGASHAAAPTVQPISFRAALNGGPGLTGATKGVVSVYAGEGFGSGVLISSDGYVLTNHHVAGATGQVRVHWPDGTDTVGEVLRSDPKRDVAVIRTTPHGPPLSIRRSAAQVGEPVFAIGTPLSKDLSNTVTRGIVSAMRTLEGEPWIQSDVAVTHGNSGGPLVDEGGEILGLTAWGVAPNGASANINFFIPIDDALRALALQPTVGAASAPTAPPTSQK